MCTENKLRRAGDQPARELSKVRNALVEAVKAKELAESESRNKDQRIMCVTRNADVSHCGMIYSNMVSVVLFGLLVYVL